MEELSWIREGLADRRLSIVAKKTGLSIPTVRAVKDGKGNPTIETLEKLRVYLAGSQ